MKVTLLFFSVLRDLSGCDRLELELPPHVATLSQLLDQLDQRMPGLAGWEGRLLLAVNGEYAAPSTTLANGDEIALMPPVQGG
jgi:molybdopterin converting factor subunit 1